MQLFHPSTTSAANPRSASARRQRPLAENDAAGHCATLLLETMPRVLKAVRVAVGNDAERGLNVPQFRTLMFVDQHAGASLSTAAEFLGLSLPSASKLVDGLVKRGMLMRQSDRKDRRRMTLRLTRKGDALLSGVQETVRGHLAGMLDRMDTGSLGVLAEALRVLQANFPPLGGDPSPAANR
jgi:DNA-binding MarR family transcriptional regulator